MQIKLFHAETMHEAIRAIKAELGPDAVILSSKRVSQGSLPFGLFGRPLLEVTAAIDRETKECAPIAQPNNPVVRQNAPPAAPAQEPVSAFQDTLSALLRTSDAAPPRARSASRPAPAAPPPSRSLPMERVHRLKHELRDLHQRLTVSLPDDVPTAIDRETKECAPIAQPNNPVVRHDTPLAAPAQEPVSAFQDTLSALLRTSDAAPPRARSASRPAPVAPPPSRSLSMERVHRLKHELRDLHQRLTASLPDDVPTAGAGFPAPIARACRQLIAQGLRTSSAESLCLALRHRLAPKASCSDGEIQELLHHLLAAPIRVSGPLLNRGDQFNVAMFVGPSGVGKTTAIVKLAAHYRLEEHKSVVLITLDTCRMAAVEHLRTYANVLGVGLETAQTTTDVIDGIRRHRGANLILIDTPGYGENETARLTNLGGLKDSYGPIETHLVLSATTRMQDLRRTLARYDVCAPSRLLFTRLDETVEYGNLFELPYQTTLPLSYWGIGQQVPEDLELAQPGRLADLLLERGSVRFTSPGLSSSIGRDSVVSLGGTTPQHA